MGLTSILFFTALLVLLIVERLAELQSAKNNFQALREQGGREFGAEHYPFIVVMHVLFFVSLIVEFIMRGAPLLPLWPIPFVLLLLGQAIRYWGRRTMRGRWTTRVIVVRGERLIQKGPYAIIPHPIYLAVVLELFSLPLIFGLYVTCAAFTALNFVMLLAVRIPSERRALDWSQGKETGPGVVN